MNTDYVLLSKRERIERIILVGCTALCALFLIFFFIPHLEVYAYQYPYPEGEQPERVMTMMSPFNLLNNESAPIGNIAFVVCLCELVLSILCFTVFRKNVTVARYVCYALFVTLVVLVFIGAICFMRNCY